MFRVFKLESKPPNQRDNRLTALANFKAPQVSKHDL